MPAIASNIPTPQLALNNKANIGLPSLGGLSNPSGSLSGLSGKISIAGPQTTTPSSNPYLPAGTSPAQGTVVQGTPQPSTPLKSTTTTSPNGASVTNTYHPPATPQTATGGSTGLPPAPTAPLASAASEPAYNPNQPATTVYHNGVATTNQNGVQVSGYTPQVPQTQSQGTTTASSPTSFPGIVSGLASTAAQGSPNATSATQGLLNAPSQNAGLVSQAQQIGTQYGNDIEKTSNYGNALAGSYTNGAGLAPVSQGLAGQAQQTTAAEVQGEQAAEQAALNPINQELAAQAQGQSGLAAAGGIANTQQANVQSGLNSAGTLAQPSATGAGQTTYNPLTNSFSGGSSSENPTQAPSGYTQADWNQIVSNVANGNLSAISGLPTVLQSQAQAAAQAQNPNFNINAAEGGATGQQNLAAAPGTGAATGIAAQAAAPGTASAQNTVTAGTAETNALQAVYGANAPAAYTLNTALNNIQSLGSLTLQTAQGGNINPLSTQVGNQTIAQFRNGLGSASQATFNSNMSAFASSLSALYADQSGATPTQVSTWATQIANGSMPMQQLQSIYGAAISEGNLRLTNLKNTATSAYSAEQGTAGGSTGNTGGTGAFSDSSFYGPNS